MNKVIQMALKNARKELLRTGSLRLKFFLTNDTGATKVITVHGSADGVAEWEVIFNMIREIVNRARIRSVVTVWNYWFSEHQSAEGAMQFRQRIESGEDLPETREAIFATYEHAEGFQTATVSLYRREWNGKIKFEDKLTGLTVLSGPFVGFFDQFLDVPARCPYFELLSSPCRDPQTLESGE